MMLGEYKRGKVIMIMFVINLMSLKGIPLHLLMTHLIDHLHTRMFLGNMLDHLYIMLMHLENLQDVHLHFMIDMKTHAYILMYLSDYLM